MISPPTSYLLRLAHFLLLFAEQLAKLFTEAGFEVLDNEYVCKEVVNRKRELNMQRIFVQARLRKIQE